MSTVKRSRWTLLAIVGLAFAIRVMGLDFQSLWRDEIDAIRFASAPIPQLLGMFVEPGQNGPLYFLLLRPWLVLIGDGAFGFRFLSVVFGVLTVPLMGRVGQRLFPELSSVGIVAALLAATSPFLVWYSQEGKMYAAIVFLVLLVMERYSAALDQGGWQRWLVVVCVTSIAFYVHLIAAFVVPVQILVFLSSSGEIRRARWKGWLASMAALTVPYVPLLLWQLPMLVSGAETGYRFVPIHEMLYSLLVSYSLGITPSAARWSMLPFVGSLLAVGYVWWQNRHSTRSVFVVLCWLLVPVLGFFVVTLVRPIFTARYLIFVSPAYVLLLAYAIAGIAEKSRQAAGLLFVSLLVVQGWGVVQQATTPMKADFRGATRYVSERLGRDDLVIFLIPHGRYSFDYYYEPPEVSPEAPGAVGEYRVWLPWLSRTDGPRYLWADGLYTNADISPEQVDAEMHRLAEGRSVVWLVATETEMWDERGLVRSWLDEHARLVECSDFTRVEVMRFELL